MSQLEDGTRHDSVQCRIEATYSHRSGAHIKTLYATRGSASIAWDDRNLLRLVLALDQVGPDV